MVRLTRDRDVPSDRGRWEGVSALGDAVRLRREELGMGQEQLVSRSELPLLIERAWQELWSRDTPAPRPVTDEEVAAG